MSKARFHPEAGLLRGARQRRAAAGAQCHGLRGALRGGFELTTRLLPGCLPDDHLDKTCHSSLIALDEAAVARTGVRTPAIPTLVNQHLSLRHSGCLFSLFHRIKLGNSMAAE
ncbi:hypothetical protein Q5H93_00335 [Hymenobacter sp. ASUV-10]|uniref:Uncharacterized protein n=1 Tax=Hymenobacter aranciens TaxID=3063996 RepID=A0ABT9B845_9BACT|nr:hypothetical protein [Hymenobacter sp. ASUV-10]MDO7873162.1 hypothetical protein [Hymenobacter sp. ASUV-10]